MALIKSPDDLLALDADAVIERINSGELLTPDEIVSLFQITHALFIHMDVQLAAGTARKVPHLLLTSGKHSDVYYDCPRVLQYTKLCRILAAQLIMLLRQAGQLEIPPTVVLGSCMAAITMSYEVASQLGCRHIHTDPGPDKTKVLSRYEINPGDRLLMVEELITTLLTSEAQEAAIIAATNPPYFTIMPVLGVVVNRAGLSTFHERPIISVLDTQAVPALEQHVYDPDDCPLCKAGSPLCESPKQKWNSLFDTSPDPALARVTLANIPGSWECPLCTAINLPTADHCECGADKPAN
jgi:orotate phosphoribosyltransferase